MTRPIPGSPPHPPSIEAESGRSVSDVRSADRVRVRYEVHGNGAPAVVFVHGWSCDRTYWRRQVDHFAGRFTVVTIDLAGHGESGTGRRTWTMPAFGDDVLAVATELDLPDLVLVGHSMGGDVIIEAARGLPRRVGGLVWVDTYRSLDESGSDETVAEEAAAFVARSAPTSRPPPGTFSAAFPPPARMRPWSPGSPTWQPHHHRSPWTP
jgi:pimeloyl-ACP methyl ester carboxylesterase